VKQNPHLKDSKEFRTRIDTDDTYIESKRVFGYSVHIYQRVFTHTNTHTHTPAYVCYKISVIENDLVL